MVALLLKPPENNALLLTPAGKLTTDPDCCCGTGTGTAPPVVIINNCDEYAAFRDTIGLICWTVVNSGIFAGTSVSGLCECSLLNYTMTGCFIAQTVSGPYVSSSEDCTVATTTLFGVDGIRANGQVLIRCDLSGIYMSATAQGGTCSVSGDEVLVGSFPFNAYAVLGGVMIPATSASGGAACAGANCTWTGGGSFYVSGEPAP